MPLSDQYPRAVTFIIGPRKQDDGTIKDGPIGTGFVVAIPGRRHSFRYVVTAKHVVYEQTQTACRFRTLDGGTKDVPVPEWIHHPDRADVSVAPLVDQELDIATIPAWALVYAEPHLPQLGDRVYYLGLLDLYEEMTRRNVPMVRSGSIGALYQQDVPVKFHGAVTRIEAHLIDCRSYEGFSGSPCFFQRDNVPLGLSVHFPSAYPTGGKFEDLGTQTLLLGLLSGHFDSWADTRPREPNYEPDSKSMMNTGVGIVTTAERILEVLLVPELDKRRGEEENTPGPEGVGTADSLGYDESEFDRFERLTHQLINTPMPDADAKQ